MGISRKVLVVGLGESEDDVGLVRRDEVPYMGKGGGA